MGKDGPGSSLPDTMAAHTGVNKQLTVPGWLWSVLSHTHPLQCHSLRTVSGRFLSLSSLLSKHWAMMGFTEPHMVCEVEDGPGLSVKSEMCTALRRIPTHPSLPASLTSFRFRKRRSLFLSRNPGRGEQMGGEGEPPPCPTGPGVRILTSHAVGHLSSVMQKAELPSVEGFPGLLVSELVPAGDKDRKLQISVEEALRAIQEGASRPLGCPTNGTLWGRLCTPAAGFTEMHTEAQNRRQTCPGTHSPRSSE